MITSKGWPTVTLAATEEGGTGSRGGESDPTYAALGARRGSTSLKLVNRTGGSK